MRQQIDPMSIQTQDPLLRRPGSMGPSPMPGPMGQANPAMMQQKIQQGGIAGGIPQMGQAQPMGGMPQAGAPMGGQMPTGPDEETLRKIAMIQQMRG